MKLTLAFLAALAAADASSHHKHVRRQGYGNGNGYGNGGYGNGGYGNGGYGNGNGNGNTPSVASASSVRSTAALPTQQSSSATTPSVASPTFPGGNSGYGGSSAASSVKPVQSAPSSLVQSAPSSLGGSTTDLVFTPSPSSSVVVQASSGVSPPAGGYGTGTGVAPVSSPSSAVLPSQLGSSSSSVVIVNTPSSKVIPTGTGYTFPGPGTASGASAQSSAPSSGFSSVQAETPSAKSIPTFPGTGIKSTGFPSATFPGTSPTGVFPTGTLPSPTVAGNASESVITSTIYSTQIFTKPCNGGCKSGASPVLVTSVVPIATTICPASEAGKTALPTGPVVAETSPISVITHVSSKTFVYTIGTGSTAKATTTVTELTSTETLYKTVFVTKAKSTGSPNGATAVGSQASGTLEGTTTIKSTSTTTVVVTVVPTPSGSGSGSGGAGGYGGASSVLPLGSGGAGGECAAPTTVTITQQQTVTVTAGTGPAATPQSVIPGGPVSSAIPTAPAPFPLGNSTVLPSNLGPSGFSTRASRPHHSHSGTGVSKQPQPTGTGAAPTNLPTFSFPGGQIQSTVLPSQASAASASASVASASQSGGFYPATTGVSQPVASSTVLPLGGSSTPSPSKAAASSPSAASPASTQGGGYGYGGGYRRRV